MYDLSGFYALSPVPDCSGCSGCSGCSDGSGPAPEPAGARLQALGSARRGAWRDESGQATAEYGLVIVAAAGVAAALIAFANANIGKLFTTVLSKVLQAAS